ncbi:hypothetical protein [Sphingomonas sp. LY160]|uniref:hypothetical protein n=1 Tax=Sphingomonas sp. LY160 TaxID=3095342 RepID=UPI002ADEE112|nr:hypothetical protein [Sphingomonas sp. LY160]MEA1072190.1 hypothetical protein [Sphingomonas sp. LY160]
MNRTEALVALNSQDLETRLAGARFMALNARRVDLALLRRFQRTEKVRWIRTALERAVEQASRKGRSEAGVEALPGEPSPEVVRDLRAEAIEEVAGTIIHEFAPLVGLLRTHAPREILDYEKSNTRKNLELLSALMRAVRELKSSAAVALFEELDLSAVVSDAVATLSEEHRPNILLAGPQPFAVIVDRDQILLAIGNGLRNACEAAAANIALTKPAIIVNWGHAGAEDWLAILDSGAGFSGNPAAALKMGVTTKADHIGFGLATAQQAMRTIEGDVYLTNREEGGAKFELRWFRHDANSIRGRQ